MKVRRDYVTNSSSSSFIVAYKQLPKVDAELIEKYPYLSAFESMMEKAIFESGRYETEEATVFESLDEWDAYWVYENRYYLRDSWDREETVENIMRALTDREKETGWSYQDEKDSYLGPAKYLKEGYKVFEKRVSYDDAWIEQLIRGLEDGENFILINSHEA